MKNFIANIGKSTALLSFMIGTVILLKYAISLDSLTIEVGTYFIKYAFVGNLIVIVLIFISMLIESKNIPQYSKISLWMLANIPVAIIYVLITAYFDSLSEVTCINDFKEPIKDVELNWGNGKETWCEIEPTESFFERFKTYKAPVVLKYKYLNQIHHDTLYYQYPIFSEISSYSICEKTKRIKTN
jgi:hypothetical protein